MSWSLRFGSRLVYDPSQPSITVPVHLSTGEERVTASAKLDTGASHSIFRRELGEELGPAIETGERLKIETVTGHFVCYGHGVTLVAVDVAIDRRSTSRPSTASRSMCSGGGAGPNGCGSGSSTTTACYWRAPTTTPTSEDAPEPAQRSLSDPSTAVAPAW